MTAVTIRHAQAADIDGITPMYEWLFAPPGSRPQRWDPQRASASLGRVIAADRAVALVAVAEGQFVGLCVAYDELESVRFGRRVWVEDLAVHPDFRSQGIGKRLLDEAKRWAQARGATRLQLDSAEGRTDAHRFYEREGANWRSVSYGWELLP